MSVKKQNKNKKRTLACSLLSSLASGNWNGESGNDASDTRKEKKEEEKSREVSTQVSSLEVPSPGRGIPVITLIADPGSFGSFPLAEIAVVLYKLY